MAPWPPRPSTVKMKRSDAAIIVPTRVETVPAGEKDKWVGRIINEQIVRP